jgi:hypothetical protein
LFTIKEFPGMNFRYMDTGGAYVGRELKNPDGSVKDNPRAGIDVYTRPGGADQIPRHITMQERGESDAARVKAAGGVDHGYHDEDPGLHPEWKKHK